MGCCILGRVAEFLRGKGCIEVVVIHDPAEYYKKVGFGANSLGGILHEGTVPFKYCDNLGIFG